MSRHHSASEFASREQVGQWQVIAAPETSGLSLRSGVSAVPAASQDVGKVVKWLEENKREELL